MGLVTMGPPTELLLLIQSEFGVQHFVELGTYRGKTAEWASNYFRSVSTVEFSRKIYEETLATYKHIDNIEFIYGDSRETLGGILEAAAAPCLLWLDSHWSGGETYGEEDECPLMDELNIINQHIESTALEHFILIDDARLFLSPPPKPHKIENWPTIDQAIQVLSKYSYYVAIYNDAIIAVPQIAQDKIAAYLQDQNTIAWQQRPASNSAGKFKEGSRMIAKGVQLIIAGAVNKANQVLGS